MSEPQSGILKGLERKVIFNRLRAAVGLRLELPWLTHGMKIPHGCFCLEIGTGLGWGTLGLFQRNDSIEAIATDYDREILPLARSFLNQHQAVSHVTFCQTDTKCLPFSDSSFDLVLALYVLHHVCGYRQALKEIGRVTKLGGKLLLIDFVRTPLIPHFRGWFLPAGLPSRNELAQLLAEAGFHIELWRRLPVWALITARKEEGCKSLIKTKIRS